MLLGMIVNICNFKKILHVGQKKKTPNFRLLLLKFFSHLQNFLKIGIDTHPIDLSCHQKFEKIHRLEAKMLAHEVGKEKVRVD